MWSCVTRLEVNRVAAKKKQKQRKQNKPNGHFCYVCGEHKANEKFTGSGHAHHICKQCQKLPLAERNELVAVRKIDNMAFRHLSNIVSEAKAGGIELPTFTDTLLVTETERLKIRRFYRADLDSLWVIMKKPEVMYAWESGFKKSETRKWLNHQFTRYHKDGYGYFAVTLKESGKLIGQAGLMKSEVNGETVVEIGYIFDDAVWGQGYAVEASRACVGLAFNQFGFNELYASIRPENTASVMLAEKLGMRKIGEYIKTYQDKEMLHDIYMLKNTSAQIIRHRKQI
jgi:RimJ/RimL family protein N-acetyltransferase